MLSTSLDVVDFLFFFFQAEDGIRDYKVTGVQTCALPICRDVSLLRLSHAKAGDELVRHLDPGEAGCLEPADQLSLVPPYERSPPVLLAGLVIVLDFTPLRLKPVIESAGAHPIPYLLRDLVDGLEDGHPAPGLQHPVELANTRLLIGEVDQDRTRHYDVDALACQWNVQRVTAHASQGSDIRRRFCLAPALRQRVGGPIDGYHASRPLYAFARLKGQQAGSCSEIDHSLTWPKPRLTQNTVANSSERPMYSPHLDFRGAAVSPADKPVRPAVQLPICAVRGSRGHRSGS